MRVISYKELKQYQKDKKETELVLGRGILDGEIKDSDILDNFKIDDNGEGSLELKFRLGVCNNSLKKARAEKGLSQKDVQDLTGINHHTYSSIECCNIYPSEKVQRQIARVMEKTIAHLFPEWLRIFTIHWKRKEKEKLVVMDNKGLKSKEALSLIEGTDLSDKANDIVLKAKISSLLDCLSPRERFIIEMRFGIIDGKACILEEVGREFDVTRERIRHLEQRAFTKIKAAAESKGFDLEDLIKV